MWARQVIDQSVVRIKDTELAAAFDATTKETLFVTQALLDRFPQLNKKGFFSFTQFVNALDPNLLPQFLEHLSLAIEKKHSSFCVEIQKYEALSQFLTVEISLTERAMALANNPLILINIQDVTTVQEEKLSFVAKSKRLHEILTSIDAAVMVVDAQTREIVYVNEALLKMTGFTEDELMFQVCHNLVCPNETGNCPIIDKGQAVDRRECIMYRKGDTPLFVWKSVKQIDIGGKMHLIETAVDISELAKLRNELAESNKKLQAWLDEMKRSKELALEKMKEAQDAKVKLEAVNIVLKRTIERLEEEKNISARLAEEAKAAEKAKDQFFAVMTHELRTPLNAIIGITDLLSDTSLDAREKEYLDLLRGASQSLLDLVNDILDFSRIKAGKLELEDVPFDLYQLIKDTVYLYFSQAERKAIELFYDVDPQITGNIYHGDPAKLKQVIINFISNAIKFTETGGVFVHIYAVSKKPDYDTVRIDVIDSGIGFPIEKKDLLFKPFVQSDTYIKRQFGGTGLGLSISKEIIKAMGGQIGCSSEPEKGSDFFVVFDLKRANAREKSSSATKIDIDQKNGLSVCVISDNTFMQEKMPALLFPLRLTVFDTSAVLDESIEVEQPDTVGIILDVTGSHCIDVYYQLRSIERYKEKPIIMLMSKSFHKRFENILLAPEVFLLKKPLLASDLRKAVSDIFINNKPNPSYRYTIEPPLGSADERKRDADVLDIKVLVAEDNATNQLVIRKILETIGVSAVFVDNGLDAVVNAGQQEYDLIIMDVQMPRMDGIEATKRIRAGEAGEKAKGVKIITMTAFTAEKDIRACYEAGADLYISKPIDKKGFIGKIMSMFPDRIRADRHDSKPKPGQDDSKGANGIQGREDEKPLFNLPALLARTDGDVELAKAVAQSLLSDFPFRFQQAQKAFDSGDWKGLRASAHTIKGAAGTSGAEVLQDAAYALQLAAEGSDSDKAQKLLSQVDELYNHTRDKIKEWLEKKEVL